MASRDEFMEYCRELRQHGAAGGNAESYRILRNFISIVVDDTALKLEIARLILLQHGHQHRFMEAKAMRAALRTTWLRELVEMHSGVKLPLVGETHASPGQIHAANKKRKQEDALAQRDKELEDMIICAETPGGCEACGAADAFRDHQRMNGRTLCVDCLAHAVAVIRRRRHDGRCALPAATATINTTTPCQATYHNEDSTSIKAEKQEH